MYEAKATKHVTGASRRQLRYWEEIGLIVPSIEPTGCGTGHRRRWSFTDLVALRVVSRLRGQGFPLQRVRRVVEFLRQNYPQQDHPLAGGTLVLWGKDILGLAPGEDMPVSTIRAQGQPVTRLSLADISSEVSQALQGMDPVVLRVREERGEAKAV